MNVPFISKTEPRTGGGFSVLELLIVAVMISVVTGFFLVEIVKAQKAISRNHAATQFVAYIERARNDSMRRRATSLNQMAQLKIVNDKFYTVTVDSNGDGVLDTPLGVSLAEQDLILGGPFPRTLIFDRLGRTVDPHQNVIQPAVITL